LGEFNNIKMASGICALAVSIEQIPAANAPLRELFEACKTRDISRAKKLIWPHTVNARDTAGRKSTPIHFAAGVFTFLIVNICIRCIEISKHFEIVRSF
jgi:hypothetical protein